MITFCLVTMHGLRLGFRKASFGGPNFCFPYLCVPYNLNESLKTITLFCVPQPQRPQRPFGSSLLWPLHIMVILVSNE